MEPAHDRGRRAARNATWLQGFVALLLPLSAHASFLHGDTLDTFATYMAWFVLIVMPIVGIVIFWLLHVMPVKMAERRHHPQLDGIHMLCLLSLLFGGLLWPLAWLWTYTKPASYKIAYGTDKHEEFFHEKAAQAKAGELLEGEIAHLREELDAMAQKGALSPKLRTLRDDLATVQAKPAASGTAGVTA